MNTSEHKKVHLVALKLKVVHWHGRTNWKLIGKGKERGWFNRGENEEVDERTILRPNYEHCIIIIKIVDKG